MCQAPAVVLERVFRATAELDEGQVVLLRVTVAMPVQGRFYADEDVSVRDRGIETRLQSLAAELLACDTPRLENPI